MSLALMYQSHGSTKSDGTPSTSLLFGGAYIDREAFTALRSADAVLRHAETAAEELRKSSVQAFEAQLQEAAAKGFAQGRADAMAAVLGNLEVERRMRDLLSSRLAELVEQCVRNILGEFTPQELLRRRVLHLLRSTAVPGGATLYVCPQQVPIVQTMLRELAGPDGEDFADLTVISDESRELDALLLETKLGFLDANLRLTLLEARQMIERAVSQATQRLKTEAW